MAGHTNLVEEAMETLDNRCDLLRQVGSVHDEPGATATSVWLPYWRIMDCGMCAWRNAEQMKFRESSWVEAFAR